MRFADFSSWPVIALFAGILVKYVFSDALLFLQRRLERAKNDRSGYEEVCSAHPDVRELVPFDSYVRSAEYSEANYRFGLVSGGFSRLVSAAVLACCAYPLAAEFFMKWRVFAEYPVLTIIAVSVAVDAMETLLSVPFDLYDTFVIEKRFGFNTQTLGCWFGDFWKNLAVGSAYSAVVVSASFYLIRLFTSCVCPDIASWRFVACAGGAGVLFDLAYESAWIGWIAPLFNRFTPMADGDLKRKIVNLISSAGFVVSDIYVMDAGRRSRHSNAYFAGWGRQKRIVLYDTLLKDHSDDEILAILGHEAGHLVHRDILKGRIEGALYSAARLAVCLALMTDADFYRAFGFSFVTDGNMQDWYVVGYWFASTLVGAVDWLLDPLQSWFSRRCEYAADAYSKAHTPPGAMAKALVRMYAANLSGMHDHPFYEFWYYGHPGFRNRLNALTRTGRAREGV